MTDSPATIEPLNAIVCDDIRREVTRKYIAIGIYTEGINVPELPAPVMIALMLLAKPRGVGDVSFQLEIRTPSGKAVGGKVTLKIQQEHKPYQILTLPFPRMFLTIEKAGDLEVRFRIKGGDWQVLRTIPVAIDPKLTRDFVVTDAPNEPEQPA